MSSHAPAGGPVRLVLAHGTRIVANASVPLVAARGGSALEIPGDSGAVASAILEFVRTPRTHEELGRHLAALSDEPFDGGVIDELVGALVEAGVVVTASAAPSIVRSRDAGRIVVGVSGAIQSVEAPRLVLELLAMGFEVRVAMTEAAKRFVSEGALAAISHAPVASTIWAADPSHPVPHIELAAWADLVLVYPASATTISRIASGDCSDIVAAIAVATRAPVVIAPSMNEAMLGAPAVARNLETLVADGFHVLAAGAGVEVADAPGARVERSGPALSAADVASLAPLLMEKLASTGGVRWDDIHASGAEFPWEAPGLDADVLAALDETPPPRSLLDLGTGAGALAIAAAARGYRVVATDLSEAALARASAKAGATEVLFVRDDVRASSLRGRFDVVVDRGCLHTLRADELGAASRSLATVTAPGARLLAVHDAAGAPSARRTLRLEPAELARALGAFEVERFGRTTLVAGEPNGAWLTILRRVER